MKKEWKVLFEYSSKEILLEKDKVIMKNYFDPGKDPNVTKASFEDFLSEKYKNEISWDFGNHVYEEVVNNIHEILNSNDNIERDQF